MNPRVLLANLIFQIQELHSDDRKALDEVLAIDGPSKVEVEISLRWASSNPDLFLATVRRFERDCPSGEWARRVDTSRTGFITLIGERK